MARPSANLLVNASLCWLAQSTDVRFNIKTDRFQIMFKHICNCECTSLALLFDVGYECGRGWQLHFRPFAVLIFAWCTLAGQSVHPVCQVGVPHMPTPRLLRWWSIILNWLGNVLVCDAHTHLLSILGCSANGSENIPSTQLHVLIVDVITRWF